ncbi:MAG: indole-3-glycerol phosphate synthase TrpC [Myxococcota bacterium]
MSTILDRIVAQTRERLLAYPPNRTALERTIEAQRHPPVDAATCLRAPGPHIIAEVKRRSPSAGTIRSEVDPVALAQTYAGAGASAVSVLTEPEHFGGSLDDLSAISSAIALPCLRKDFIVSDLQLLEARASGASMALLIVAALSPEALRSLITSCASLGLLALVEAHTHDEILKAVDAGAPFIGVNSRDLRDFSIDIGRAEALRGVIPDGTLAVAESGIHTPQDLGRLSEAGYDIFLIGTSLMSSGDPAATLKSLMSRGAR